MKFLLFFFIIVFAVIGSSAMDAAFKSFEEDRKKNGVWYIIVALILYAGVSFCTVTRDKYIKQEMEKTVIERFMAGDYVLNEDGTTYVYSPIDYD